MTNENEKRGEEDFDATELGAAFEMTDEEKALLEKMESGEPLEEPSVEPPPPEPPEEPPAPEPPAEPPAPEPLPPGLDPPPIQGVQQGQEPPPIPTDRVELPTDRDPTMGELAAFIRQMAEDQKAGTEHARGLRDDLIRERERRRVAEYMASVNPPAPTLPEPDGEPPGTKQTTPEGIPIVMGEDGTYEVDKQALSEFISSRQAQPEAQPEAPPSAPPPGTPDPRLEAFGTLRSALIAEAADPIQTQQAVDELRDALFWIDRRLTAEGPRLQTQVEMGRGLETIHSMLELSGVGKQFSDAYGMDPMDLIEVGMTLEPFKAKRLVQKYISLKAQRATTPPATDPPPVVTAQPARAEPPPPGQLDQDRPPPMAQRGSVESPAPSAKKYAEMSPMEVLGLSDEEYKEMERLALSE